jgi:hypothetical protein
MNSYDPNIAPEPKVWLELKEKLRISFIEKYHRDAHIKLPNLATHAVFHLIVENQVAENLESVVRAMARLTAEGLDRHDAVHAIGSVLAVHMHDLFKSKADVENSQSIYNAAVERLSAKAWHGG